MERRVLRFGEYRLILELCSHTNYVTTPTHKDKDPAISDGVFIFVAQFVAAIRRIERVSDLSTVTANKIFNFLNQTNFHLACRCSSVDRAAFRRKCRSRVRIPPTVRTLSGFTVRRVRPLCFCHCPYFLECRLIKG